MHNNSIKSLNKQNNDFYCEAILPLNNNFKFSFDFYRDYKEQ